MYKIMQKTATGKFNCICSAYLSVLFKLMYVLFQLAVLYVKETKGFYSGFAGRAKWSDLDYFYIALNVKL